MSMYTAVVYPQIAVGGEYSRPVAPNTLGAFAFAAPGWDLASANPVNRTEYWEDSAGILTEAYAIFLCYGPAGKPPVVTPLP